jgi:hypothetical protein
MGYQTDTYLLANALPCTGAATPGILTLATPVFSGSNFTRGRLRVKFAAITTAPTSLFLFFQDQDTSGTPGATDWYPNAAAAQLAAFVTALTAKDPNNNPVVGGQVLLTAAPATTDRYSVPFTGIPGNTFRLGVLAIGAAAAFTLTVTGDFAKTIPDNT